MGMINIVSIDPSIISTAVTINGKIFAIAADHIALTKKLKYNKWFELSSTHCDIITIDTGYNGIKAYSQLECEKLKTYQTTANIIKNLVDTHRNTAYTTVVLIEGYSYSSSSGPLIDLVTYGTLVRNTLSELDNVEIVIMAPTSVKKMAAEMTYEPTEKGKRVIKLEYRNYQGVAGGSFKKPDMYKALTENITIDTDWVNFLREYQHDILLAKSIPKPIEDINDSIIMYHIAIESYKKCLESLEGLLESLRK